MIRIRSLATTYARECVRSAASAGRSGSRGGGVRAAVAVRALSESSSTLPSAQPPFNPHGDQVHAEEGLDATHPGQEWERKEEVDGVGELLQRHAQAREEWTQPVQLTGHERTRISKDLVGRIRSLAKANKSTKMDVAIEILDEGRRRGVKSLPIYRAVLKQLLSTFRQAEVASKNLELILDRMREDGLQPDLKTYHLILDFHGAVRNPEEAVAVYEEMVSRGIQPDQKTASYMIVAHSRGCHDDMFRTVQEMKEKGWKGSRGAYLSMIAVMGIRRDYEGILDTIRRMREESKKPTEAAFVGAFRAAEHLGQVDTAGELFEHRMEVGLQPQEYVYVKMMVMLLKEGRAEEALVYWRQLVCVNGLNEMQITPETYNLAIKCASFAVNIDEMEAVVAMMEAQGVVPTETTYVAALVGFEGPAGGNPRMEGAKRAFAAIARTGPPPGTNLLQRTAVAYAHARMWQEAFDMFGSVLKDGGQLSARDWKCLMMSQFELGKYAEVKETWALSTEGRNTSHSYPAFEYALKTAGVLEDADWALELREAAGKAGKGSVDFDRMVADVLLRVGRLEEARAVLKAWEALELRGPNIRVFEEVYQTALAMCEQRGDAELAIEFFDGMQSAVPPYHPRVSCPSFEFVLRSLKDGGRAGEVGPLADEARASSTSQDAGETALSVECHAVIAEAMSMDESELRP